MLNIASLARSVVGLTGKFFGILNRLPLCVPAIMRMSEVLVVAYGYVGAMVLNSKNGDL